MRDTHVYSDTVVDAILSAVDMPKRLAAVDFTANGNVYECGNYCDTDVSTGSYVCSPVTDWVISQAGHASKCMSAGMGELAFEMFVAQRQSLSRGDEGDDCVRTTVLDLNVLQPWTGHITDASGLLVDTCTEAEVNVDTEGSWDSPEAEPDMPPCAGTDGVGECPVGCEKRSEIIPLRNVFQLRYSHSLMAEAGLPSFSDDAEWFHSNCDGLMVIRVSDKLAVAVKGELRLYAAATLFALREPNLTTTLAGFSSIAGANLRHAGIILSQHPACRSCKCWGVHYRRCVSATLLFGSRAGNNIRLACLGVLVWMSVAPAPAAEQIQSYFIPCKLFHLSISHSEL